MLISYDLQCVLLMVKCYLYWRHAESSNLLSTRAQIPSEHMNRMMICETKLQDFLFCFIPQGILNGC